MSNSPQTVIHVNSQGSSALGTAGLIFSVLGWLTCGLLCIPGTVLSFLGLFSSKPKGLAIAGLIVGFPGSLFFAFVGAGMIAAFLGVGAAINDTVARAEAARAQAQQSPPNENEEVPPTEIAPSKAVADEATPETQLSETTQVIPQTTQATQAIPETPAPESVPAAAQAIMPEAPAIEDKPLRRVFSDSSGKFKVDATVLAYKRGWLRLRRKDGGKDISVEVSKLSVEDQAWVEENSERLLSLQE